MNMTIPISHQADRPVRPTIELEEVSLARVYRLTARGWRESAAHWRVTALQAAAVEDYRTAWFADGNATEREAWAEKDDAEAVRWERLEAAAN